MKISIGRLSIEISSSRIWLVGMEITMDKALANDLLSYKIQAGMNLDPFPDFPPILWTEDYWTRMWDRVIVLGARSSYQMGQMSPYKKERCTQYRCMVFL